MKIPPELIPWLGLVAWGDIGQLTMYRDHRGNTVAFAKTYPQKPPTPGQLRARHALSFHASAWRSLPPPQKQNWRALAKKLRARGSGYTLWQHFRFGGFASALAAGIERIDLT